MTGLRHLADRRTLAYMLLATALPITHWLQAGPSAVLLMASIAMAFAVGAMHHNHAHQPLWISRSQNRLTDFWFTLFQGQPGFVFALLHVENHHRHHNGRLDLTRTDHRHNGNHLLGLLCHPLDFALRAAPHILRYAHRLYRTDKPGAAWVGAHYLLLAGIDGLLLWLDAWKASYCVLLPQAAALYFLLLSNYLQHAHAAGDSQFNHSRNFLGLINPLCFNVGYHTAHHHAAAVHWSELPAVHRQLAPYIAPELNEPSFAWYCLRIFILGAVLRRFRSVSMAPSDPHLPKPETGA